MEIIVSGEKCSFADVLPPPPASVLLVWPDYHSPLPPLGLLKLAAYHRARGDAVALVRPPRMPEREPDVVHVTSLFTYAWRAAAEAVRLYRMFFPRALIILGGVYASLMPDHAASAVRPDIVWAGLVREAEELLPAYDLVPGWRSSLLFSSRGCVRRCGFCAVPRLEPRYEAKASIRRLVSPGHSSVVLLDNNFLASPWRREVLAELAALRNARGRRYRVDFNQGLDARLMTPEVAAQLAGLKIPLVRLAYDGSEEREAVRKAVAALSEAGVRKKDIIVYVLYNYSDTPEDFLARVKDLMEWGVAAYPMRYQPLDALKKDEYIAPGWDAQSLEMVADARRVLGANGAWPPREALRRKLLGARSFAEAFALEPPRKKAWAIGPLAAMWGKAAPA